MLKHADDGFLTRDIVIKCIIKITSRELFTNSDNISSENDAGIWREFLYEMGNESSRIFQVRTVMNSA